MSKKFVSVIIVACLISSFADVAFAQQIKPLTNIDRKLYTLTVDNAKISAPRDTLIKTYKNKKVTKTKAITMPVIFHNNSNDTLKFYSMSCSWGSFYGTNSLGIVLPDWLCEKNIPEIVAVAPQKTYKKNLRIVYYPNIKSGKRYKISMSLLKARNNDMEIDLFGLEKYARFNKIWSNEVTIR